MKYIHVTINTQAKRLPLRESTNGFQVWLHDTSGSTWLCKRRVACLDLLPYQNQHHIMFSANTTDSYVMCRANIKEPMQSLHHVLCLSMHSHFCLHILVTHVSYPYCCIFIEYKPISQLGHFWVYLTLLLFCDLYWEEQWMSVSAWISCSHQHFFDPLFLWCSKHTTM